MGKFNEFDYNNLFVDSENSDVVVGRFQAHSFSPSDMLFMDQNTSRVFQIIKNDYFDKTIKIEINGKLYNALERFYECDEKIFSIHNIDFDAVVGKSLEDLKDYYNMENKINQWSEASAEYRDLNSWAKDLKNISDGYDGTFDAQLRSLVLKGFDAIKFVSDLVEMRLHNEYFNNHMSIVKDLRFINEIRCFDWISYDDSTILLEYLMNRFGGRFWDRSDFSKD